MDSSVVPLQSMLTTIDELVVLVEASATAADRDGLGGLAADLYEVERSLRRAQRRLNRAVRAQG